MLLGKDDLVFIIVYERRPNSTEYSRIVEDWIILPASEARSWRPDVPYDTRWDVSIPDGLPHLVAQFPVWKENERTSNYDPRANRHLVVRRENHK